MLWQFNTHLSPKHTGPHGGLWPPAWSTTNAPSYPPTALGRGCSAAAPACPGSRLQPSSPRSSPRSFGHSVGHHGPHQSTGQTCPCLPQLRRVAFLMGATSAMQRELKEGDQDAAIKCSCTFSAQQMGHLAWPVVLPLQADKFCAHLLPWNPLPSEGKRKVILLQKLVRSCSCKDPYFLSVFHELTFWSIIFIFKVSYLLVHAKDSCTATPVRHFLQTSSAH